MFRFSIDDEALARMVKWVSSIYDAANETDIMVGAVRAVGNHNYIQFHTRGAYFGKKWQNISRSTEAIRELRGQGPYNPPLQPLGNNGWLFPSVTGHLAGMPWNNKVWNTADKPYRGVPNDGPSNLSVVVMSRSAVIKLSGPKAAHMVGDRSKTPIGYGGFATAGLRRRERASANRYGRGYLPPRPFWGLRTEVLEDATTLMVNRLYISWANNDSTHKTWYKPSLPEHVL